MADAKAAESAGPPNPVWPLKDKEGFVTVIAIPIDSSACVKLGSPYTHFTRTFTTRFFIYYQNIYLYLDLSHFYY